MSQDRPVDHPSSVVDQGWNAGTGQAENDMGLACGRGRWIRAVLSASGGVEEPDQREEEIHERLHRSLWAGARVARVMGHGFALARPPAALAGAIAVAGCLIVLTLLASRATRPDPRLGASESHDVV